MGISLKYDAPQPSFGQITAETLMDKAVLARASDDGPPVCFTTEQGSLSRLLDIFDTYFNHDLRNNVFKLVSRVSPSAIGSGSGLSRREYHMGVSYSMY